MDIPELIKTELAKIPDTVLPNGASHTVWTKEIKKTIGALGIELDERYEVCAGGENDFESEWLYDLVWYKQTSDSQLMEVPLILESEWATDYFSIKYYFEKLLVGNAQHKVMVFQATGSIKEDYFARLKDAIKVFKSSTPGDTYILACFDEHEWKFDFRIHTTPISE